MSEGRKEPKLWQGIPGWGVDLDPSRRPGVPMENPPHVAAGAHWVRPEQQQSDVTVFKRVGLDQLTPVYGTVQPPHGISGVIRRFAYSLPEHHAGHWMTLLMADRVDVLESAIGEQYEKRPRAVIAAGISAAFAMLVTPYLAAKVLRAFPRQHYRREYPETRDWAA